MSEPRTLIGELEAAMQSGSDDRRTTTLRRVTDLFLANAGEYDEEQLQLFDDVLGHMVERIETKARAELSERLAPVANAPTGLMRQLASDQEIRVAGPVLRHSPRLTASDLVEIARRNGEDHALAISDRADLEEEVTDVLIEKGWREVDRRLAGNTGAHFSQRGYSTLVERAGDDEVLAERVSARRDITPQLLRQLITRATETVRARLMASATPDKQALIRDVLATVSNETAKQMAACRDYTQAQKVVEEMQREERLDEVALLQLAKAKRFEEMVCALSRLCNAPIELFDRLLSSKDCGALLIPCRAAGFTWTTVAAILQARGPTLTLAEQDLSRVANDYHQLTKATAQRVVRFWHVRESAAGGPAKATSPAAAAVRLRR
jgi:uncharacterized protein (DUF2336 family)